MTVQIRVSGSAASGKTTAMMRIATALSTSGTVAIVSRDGDWKRWAPDEGACVRANIKVFDSLPPYDTFDYEITEQNLNDVPKAMACRR